MILEVEKISEAFAKCTADDYDVLLDLNQFFSCYSDGYQFNPRFKLHLWDGKVYFFNPRTGILPIGLVPYLDDFCKKNNHTVKFINFPEYEDVNHDEYIANTKEFLKPSGMEMRDYQEAAAYEALKHRMGILQCCTSSGKSMMIYQIIRNILKKGTKGILLVVPNIMLVEQMYKDFADYGWEEIENEVEMLYGGKDPSYKLPVLISTWQSLQNQTPDFFEKYNAVIVDECHQAKASVLSKILKYCSNASYRIGTTGTLPTSKCDVMNIACVLGKILYTITSKELIDRGYLTKMIIANMFLKYPFEFIKQNRGRAYPEEVKMVEEYEGRRKALDVILKHTPDNQNILLLCNHIDHLKDTISYLEEQYPNRIVKTIAGNVKAAERELTRLSVEENEGMIIVATYGTMSTGVNIKKLHAVVLFANSKSKIKVLQSLGRGLRKHATKDKVILYDIIDDLSYQTKTGKTTKNYLLKHWEERTKFYEEQEFPQTSMVINI